MNRPQAIAFLVVFVVAVGAGVLWLFSTGRIGPGLETIEFTDYHPPPAREDEFLADDKIADKTLPAFDPALADSRPLQNGEWLVNNSAAAFRLDLPIIKPDYETYLTVLHPSYAAAIQSAKRGSSLPVLPSVNLLDGKAKQFDDGLYAALDQAYYHGLENRLLSHVQFVQRLYAKVGPDSAAAPFLAAGLSLADKESVKPPPADRAAKDKWRREFLANEPASKPIGFYTWNETLQKCHRFLRFFQREFDSTQLAIPQALARALAQDDLLLLDYRKALDFYAKLTNPYGCLSVVDILGKGNLNAADLQNLAKEKKVRRPLVSLFPSSTSRETELFEKLFPLGLPANANLMKELIQRIRSGQVNLRPGPDSGWYDYQVYALETLLLPEKGEEANKLLLTKAYKKRMLEAFQALITKRKETHARHLGVAAGSAGPVPLRDKVIPRFRVEPFPSYYLRTARAYAFLANFLEAQLGKEALQSLHGLKQNGERQQDLASELHFMRELFYGLYLISAEDIGLNHSLAADEPVDKDRCVKTAEEWQAKFHEDEDLAADTRVAVPVYIDPMRRTTRSWATLGVRLAKLEASYEKLPHLKPAKGNEEWKEAERHQLGSETYLIAVDEFAEFELSNARVLNREELRALCDRAKTKEAILEALREGR